MSKEKFELKLTDEQQEMLSKAFGESIPSLKVSVEDFSTNRGKGTTTLRVLKVDNIAAVLHSASGLIEVNN